MGTYVNDNLDALDIDRALAEVSPARRNRALRYRFPLDRRLSLAVYILLKQALRGEYGITANPEIAVNAHGKPYLPEHPHIHFSFSHCPRAAACAVADSPVGVDVEEISRKNLELAPSVLNAAEMGEVRESPCPEAEFARYWTMKEALVKLDGNGVDDALIPDLLTHREGISFSTDVNRDKGYVLTVCRRKR